MTYRQPLTESEDSIESYWEVIRPHLIERARQRKLLAERDAHRHSDILESFIKTYEKKNKDDFFKIIESRIMDNRIYEGVDRVLDGYRIKD
jgi:hypothetical protein